MKKRIASCVTASCLTLFACTPDLDANINGDIKNASRGYLKAVRFFGSAATSDPLAAASIPAHPYLAAQGRNGMHADSYATGSYSYSGPLGKNPQVNTKSYGMIGGQCATTVFDSANRVISVCSDFTGMRLVLMNPTNLMPIATYSLPLRESIKTLDIEAIMNDTSGGAYFHLMSGDKPLIANAERHLQIFSFNGSSWQVDDDFDLNPHLPDGYLVTDAIPDYDGYLWFITRQGIVGIVDPADGSVATIQLPPGEEIQNSLAADSAGVYIVSDFALYQFERNLSDAPQQNWRTTYDRGTSIKPGSISQGSGTTPTLLDSNLVAIADNADDRQNVIFYNRLTGAELCSTPVFASGRSMTENSFIGYKESIIVENNYGYENPFMPVWTEPGVTRVDYDSGNCTTVWESQEASQTTVPKLSIGNGLVYLYTREVADTAFNVHTQTTIDFQSDNFNMATDLDVDSAKFPAQAWYLTAIDYRTGVTRFKVFTGTGNNFNNNWSPVTIGPNGAAYVGVLNGIITIKDNP
jgi:hypothetical protein